MNDTTDVLLGVIFGNVIILEQKKAKSILILKLFKFVFFSLQKSRTWMMHEPQKENGNLEKQGLSSLKLYLVSCSHRTSIILSKNIFSRKGFLTGAQC